MSLWKKILGREKEDLEPEAKDVKEEVKGKAAKPVCSKCGAELLLEGVIPGHSGGAFTMTKDAADRMFSQPRACPNCQKNYCTACAFKAGQSIGKADSLYACPDCGTGLGAFGAKPTYIPNS